MSVLDQHDEAPMSIKYAKHPDTAREATREFQQSRAARLGDELDALIKMLAWTRECLENELYAEGLAYKKMGVTDKDLRKLQQLAAAMNSATQCKIRYDQSQKSLAESMTPEEEFDSVCSYIRTLDREQFSRLRARMQDYSDKLRLQDNSAVPETKWDPADDPDLGRGQVRGGKSKGEAVD